MQKKTFYTELAYLIGVMLLTLGTAMMAAAGLGLSMVIAPAYLLHLKVSHVLPFFSFGLADYSLQVVLLAALMIMLRRVKVSYLFSFVTAIFSSVLLDGAMFLIGLLPNDTIPVRVLLYLGGLFVSAVGVSLQFHAYICPAAYELFVKDGSRGLSIPIQKFKTWYDCISCAVGILLSFLFFGFGHFEGISLGTLFCAAVNGWLIGRCSTFWEKRFVFVDRLPKLKALFDR